VEVGLLRTTLLESGNWAESGRPTGRRVAFMNSYAIEDHYFNFSTTGQWLWEELHVALPSGKDPIHCVTLSAAPSKRSRATTSSAPPANGCASASYTAASARSPLNRQWNCGPAQVLKSSSATSHGPRIASRYGRASTRNCSPSSMPHRRLSK
jgi:hypothetical protein